MPFDFNEPFKDPFKFVSNETEKKPFEILMLILVIKRTHGKGVKNQWNYVHFGDEEVIDQIETSLRARWITKYTNEIMYSVNHKFLANWTTQERS